MSCDKHLSQAEQDEYALFMGLSFIHKELLIPELRVDCTTLSAAFPFSIFSAQPRVD
jgi:hypothetical protein